MEQLIAQLWGLTPWHWAALGVALTAIEVMVPSTFLIWPAMSAFAVAVALWIDPNIEWRAQVLGFAILAVISSGIWAAYYVKRQKSGDHPTLNRRLDRYTGRRLVLEHGLAATGGPIVLGDSEWPARPAGDGAIAPGTTVEVTGNDGGLLIVAPLAESGTPAA